LQNAVMELNRSKKVAFLGGAPSSKDLRPDDDYELWVLGNQFLFRKEDDKPSIIFEIHDDLSEHDEDYPQWLVDKGIHLVVGEKFPIKADHVEVFPFEEAHKILPDKLTSSSAYMMAYALLNDATHIDLYGFDMSVDDLEYFYQRPAMYAWIGYAKAKGIEVHIPEESSLFVDTYDEGKGKAGKPDLALEPFSARQFDEMAAEHQHKVTELTERRGTLEKSILAHSAARATYEQMSRIAKAVENGQRIDSLVDNTRIKSPIENIRYDWPSYK
jgi:hypothetical protein